MPDTKWEQSPNTVLTNSDNLKPNIHVPLTPNLTWTTTRLPTYFVKIPNTTKEQSSNEVQSR